MTDQHVPGVDLDVPECSCQDKTCAAHYGTDKCPRRAEMAIKWKGYVIPICEPCLNYHAHPDNEAVQ